MSNALVRGYDIFGDPIKEESRGKVADKFILSPFSVLNARDGFWQERKARWWSLGIKSELGRKENLLKIFPQLLSSLLESALRGLDPLPPCHDPSYCLIKTSLL